MVLNRNQTKQNSNRIKRQRKIYIAFNEIETFGSFSGLLMNENKTGGIWVGKLKHSKDKIEGIKWIFLYKNQEYILNNL
jgi:hypothetical protein